MREELLGEEGTCSTIVLIGDKTKKGFCIGYDPFPKKDVPEVDVINLCIFQNGKKDIYGITATEAQAMSIGLSFTAALAVNPQRLFLSKWESETLLNWLRDRKGDIESGIENFGDLKTLLYLLEAHAELTAKTEEVESNGRAH